MAASKRTRMAAIEFGAADFVVVFSVFVKVWLVAMKSTRIQSTLNFRVASYSFNSVHEKRSRATMITKVDERRGAIE